MKKLLILFAVLLLAAPEIWAAREKNDSINMATLASDTVIVISKNDIRFGNIWGIEFEFSDLDANDATVDVGTRLGITKWDSYVDSTFNSFLINPYILHVTNNADSFYGHSTVFFERTEPLLGEVLLIYINPGSVTSGYLRWTIVTK